METTKFFRVMLRMPVIPGQEQEFERVWYSVADVVCENPANIGQWLLKSAEEDGVYFVMSDWVDEGRFREFERSEENFQHRKKLHPYRLPGTMTTMHVVFDLGRKRAEAQR